MEGVELLLWKKVGRGSWHSGCRGGRDAGANTVVDAEEGGARECSPVLDVEVHRLRPRSVNDKR